MNGVASDLRSKFENNLMYVINQKSSHFPNNLPNGPMYFPDSQMHQGLHMYGEQLPFTHGIPSSMMNTHNQMQSNMSRFMNPQNGNNSMRHNSIRNPTMMPLGPKNHKTSVLNCPITDDISLNFQTSDNFPSMNSPYKSRIPSLDSGQSIGNSQNNANLVTDLIKPVNIPIDPGILNQSTTANRVQTPRNKRSRPATSRSQTPNVKESIYNQIALAPTHLSTAIRPASSNGNVIPNITNGAPHQKCLPSSTPSGNISMPYNMVDVMPQQMRPRIPVSAVTSYGCNRPPIIDKTLSMYPPGPMSAQVFSPTSQTVSPFFNQMDNGFPLPMFHLHSKLSKLPDCDRLTFPVNHGNLWGPLTLRHGDQVTEIQFELNQDNLQQIVNRSDLDIVVTSFTHRDQFRLCHWPEFLELKINGNLLSLDSTLIQDLKVHTACCIKRFCRLGSNTLQFTVSKCVCCHLFQTYMVHRPTLAHAVETIQNKCTTSISTKTLLSDVYSRNHVTSSGNPEDNGNICVVSLICPMSQVRITIPARTKCCKHAQPFDLLEFLRVQTKWPQYFCPICRVRITFNLNEYIQNLVVDEVIKDIILQTDSSVRRVILYPDGKWKSLSDMKPETVISTVPQNFQETYEQDPAIQMIRQSPISNRPFISSPQSLMQHKQNLCNDTNIDKKPTLTYPYADTDFYSSKIPNTNCSSNLMSPTLSRNHFNNSSNMGDSYCRTNTPLMSSNIEPSPHKKTRKSPSRHQYVEPLAKVASVTLTSDVVNLNSPESMKTPLSSISVSPLVCSAVSQSTSYIVPIAKLNSTIPITGQLSPINRQPSSQTNPEPELNVISSTTSFSTNLSIRTSTSTNVDNANKQTSSGSSNPSSPPEFFDPPNSSTTNYEDDDNSSLHLQRLIGFIDEILSEEEEYVLDTQWASFTWPSADKSLDLLHLSDIEKLL